MYLNLVCKGMSANSKSERIASIDVLRGIAIFGMVLCAQIGWNSGLPAWMFHAQTPPPDYAFNPEVRGLTWVDLVFPFFLFFDGSGLSVFAREKTFQRRKQMENHCRAVQEVSHFAGFQLCTWKFLSYLCCGYQSGVAESHHDCNMGITFSFARQVRLQK